MHVVEGFVEQGDQCAGEMLGLNLSRHGFPLYAIC